MSASDPYRVAERLIAYWQGTEDDALLCGALAERLEPSLRAPAQRDRAGLRQDPVVLETALRSLAAVDPVTRDLIRKLTPSPEDGSTRKPIAAPDRHRGFAPPQTEVARVKVEQNNGMIAGGDFSVEGGMVFNAPSQINAVPRPEDKESTKAQAEAVRILFLAANPQDTTPLRLDQEVRDIAIALQQARFRESFDLRQQWAVRISDLQRALLQHQPSILHFSGHGGPDGCIYLEDNTGLSRPVSGLALARLLSSFKEIRCVLLNACYSQAQAAAMAENVDCVVGMSTRIGDQAATAFSTSFYQALAYGRDVQAAFDLGCAQILLDGLEEEDTPQLLAVRCDPSNLVLSRRR